MIITVPVGLPNGSVLSATDLNRTIFHSGHNPSVTGGDGAGEVFQGRLEQVNLDFTFVPREAVRRRTFAQVPRVSSTGVNMDFTTALFDGTVVNDCCEDPVLLERAVPIPGAVATWHNRWAPRVLEIRFGLVVVVGAQTPVPDWSDPDPAGGVSSGYSNVAGDWKESAWAGMFIGRGKAAQFIEGVDNFFPLGQTQARNSVRSAGEFTASLKGYADVRTWTDRIVVDQAWLTARMESVTSGNNPFSIGEQTIGLRIACEDEVCRVKRAYISVIPRR